MGKFAKYNKSGVPLLEEDSYSSWKHSMTLYIQSIDYDLWTIIVRGYNIPESAPSSEDEKKKHQLNIKAMQLLQGALDVKVFDKMKDLKTTKGIWEKLQQ